MNDWQPSEWDRGYEAGRKAGIAETEKRIIDVLESNFIKNELLDLAIGLIKEEVK